MRSPVPQALTTLLLSAAILATVVLTPPSADAANKKKPKVTQTREAVHTRGLDAYRRAQFGKAAQAFALELNLLSPTELGSQVERDAREKLVLSLFNGNERAEAVTQYKTLRERFPDFSFDRDKVFPEVIDFFEAAVPREASTPPEPRDAQPPPPAATPADEPPTASDTTPIVASPAPPPSGPREIHPVSEAATTPTDTPKQWRWYYLAPFGIGQFMAGSPVRGALFAALQVGLVALNVVGYTMLLQTLDPDGRSARLDEARRAQLLTNIGFIGWLSALALGTLDGALLEP